MTDQPKEPAKPETSPLMPQAINPVFKARAIDQKTQDGYLNFLNRVGLNNDNSLSAGVYAFNLVTRNRIQIEAAYRGSWVVGAIVDCVAQDMTRAGITITTNEGDEDIKDMQAAIKRLQIWQSLCSLVKWGRLYGGAIGLIQIEGQDLSTPLDLETVAQGQFKGITVFDRWMLNPTVFDLINSGPEMGLPKYYQIVNDPQTPSGGVNPQIFSGRYNQGAMTVHHSRVIRSVGIELPYMQAITEMMWGESVLERLWDRLISYDNATMSTASLIDRANLRTVGVDGLRDILAAGGQAQQGLERMFEMMRALQNNEGLTLIDKEDTFAVASYSFSGLSDILLQFGQQLSGATEIPLVRLFGQSPAGLSATGESDIRMYYDTINAKQEAALRRPLDVLLKIMWRSQYGKPAPKDMEFNFTPLWQMSLMDKATVSKINTESIVGAKDAGLMSTASAMQELRQMSGDTGLFTNISDEDIAEAEKMAEEEPPPGEGEEPAAKPAKEEPEPVKNLDSHLKVAVP